MLIPTSRMASIAEGLISVLGSEPPDHAIAWPRARWLNHPSAICDRPALCTHRNSTIGTPSSWCLPSTRASAVRRWRANRSAMRGRKLANLARSANWS
jgi:hypothetical protein